MASGHTSKNLRVGREVALTSNGQRGTIKEAHREGHHLSWKVKWEDGSPSSIHPTSALEPVEFKV